MQILNRTSLDYTGYYHPVAQNIANGDGITLQGKIAIAYPPGYPIILSGFLLLAKIIYIEEEIILRIFTMLFMAIGAALMFILARMVWDPLRALLASLMWSCYPLILWTGRQPTTELPFMIFFYASLVFFLKGWLISNRSILLFFLGGIFCGISMLIRPIAFGIGILIAILLLCSHRNSFRRNVLLALCIIGGNLIAVLPWEVWVYSQTGKTIVLSSGRDSFSMLDGICFASWNPGGHRKGVSVPADVKEFMNELTSKYPKSLGSVYSETLELKDVLSIVVEKFKQQPVTVLKLIAIKTARSWYGTNSNRYEMLILTVQFIYVILLILSSWLFWKKRTDDRYLLITGIILLGYFWILTISVLSIVRYMVPILGVLMIYFPIIPSNARLGALRFRITRQVKTCY